MTETQCDALTDRMRAILAVGHCPDDLRARAQSLAFKVTLDQAARAMGPAS
ncbi:hypothetical protein [Methylobacterium sp. CM6244]